MDRSYESYQRFGSTCFTITVTLNLVLSRKQKIPDSNSKTGHVTDFRVKYGIYP